MSGLLAICSQPICRRTDLSLSGAPAGSRDRFHTRMDDRGCFQRLGLKRHFGLDETLHANIREEVGVIEVVPEVSFLQRQQVLRKYLPEVFILKLRLYRSGIAQSNDTFRATTAEFFLFASTLFHLWWTETRMREMTGVMFEYSYWSSCCVLKKQFRHKETRKLQPANVWNFSQIDDVRRKLMMKMDKCFSWVTPKLL